MNSKSKLERRIFISCSCCCFLLDASALLYSHGNGINKWTNQFKYRIQVFETRQSTGAEGSAGVSCGAPEDFWILAVLVVSTLAVLTK